MEKLSRKAAPKKTTVGRLLVYHSLPTKHQSDKILYDPKFELDKKTLQLIENTALRVRNKIHARTLPELKFPASLLGRSNDIWR